MRQGRGKDLIVIITNPVMSQGRGKDLIVIKTNPVISQGRGKDLIVGPIVVPDSSPGLL
jgi:hypothetical protein